MLPLPVGQNKIQVRLSKRTSNDFEEPDKLDPEVEGHSRSQYEVYTEKLQSVKRATTKNRFMEES